MVPYKYVISNNSKDLTLICFKRPVKVDKDWAKDCSSPISAKIESNQGILTGSEARM